MNTDYIFPRKSDLKVISINDFDIELPDLKNISESKSVVIAKWLAKYIKVGLNSGKIEYNNILPSKADFAYKLGVSIGTMQNALRYLEDLNFVESKQCIGTIVKNENEPQSFRKLTSKKDLAVEAIKLYISNNNFKIGTRLPSSRTISLIINYSSNTTRLALEYLSNLGILQHKYKNANEYGWVVKSLDFEINRKSGTQTLVDMVVKDIENYITNNLKIGDRIPSHHELSKKFNASIKTIHDALIILNKRGILLSKRGKYGTSVMKIPNSNQTTAQKPETSIFASAVDTAFYHYEKTQNYLKKMIAADYQIGDKLPSIMQLSKDLDLSPNTIRKAFHNLSKQGYLVFSRGRYGGTFVIDIPEVETQQTFKWLAVNPQYAKEYQNQN